MDFLEHNNKGAFRLKARTSTEAEFDEFFIWKPPQEIQQQQLQNGDDRIGPQKYRIVASVTPSPLIPSKKVYIKYIDDEEKKKLAKLMKQQKKATGDDLKENLSDHEKIKCDKSIKDIGDFLVRWTESEQQQKKGISAAMSGSGGNDSMENEVGNGKKAKAYNVVENNCQHFAIHLFQDLVGEYYAEKVKYAADQTQGI